MVSIIGDRRHHGYDAAKHAHEQAVLAGPLPVRVLRAAQFHEFVAQLVDWGRQGDVGYVPDDAARSSSPPGPSPRRSSRWPSRPRGVAADATITEIAGPREEPSWPIAGLLAAERGDPVRIEAVPTRDPDASVRLGRPAARAGRHARRPDVRRVARVGWCAPGSPDRGMAAGRPTS